MTKISAYAAKELGGKLEKTEFDLGELAPDQVEIDVKSCGLCHSDVSMIDNEWGFSRYPLVGGHEIIGIISAVGENVSHLQIGQTVGVGWLSQSCQSCSNCMGGSQHHCRTARPTIAGRYGGFADKVRVQSIWAIPLPEELEAKSAGPLFCGGITVFNPMLDFGLLPIHRVAVIGIGGLGHLALKFAKAWGCEVTAFTSSLEKTEELKSLGAHHVVNSRDNEAVGKLKGRFNMIISTVNVNLPWFNYMSTLAPQGKFVQVGIITDPMPVPSFSLISGQKSVAGSDTGPPSTIKTMLEFCARHDISPQVEYYKMSDINSAIDRLKSGKTRYRVVLTND